MPQRSATDSTGSQTGTLAQLTALIPTLGSRGDVQPYINLGVELVRAGIPVTIATHPFWRGTVESFGIRFYPLGPDVNLDVEAARARRSFNIVSILRLLNRLHDMASAQLLHIMNDFDVVIVSHTLCGALEAGKLKKPYISVTLLPSMVPVRATTSFSATRARRAIDALMYRLYFTFGPWGRLQRRYGLSDRTQFHQLLSPELNLLPISRHIYPPDSGWTANHVVTGIWELAHARDQPIPPELARFLDRNPRPIVVALGAMSFDTPRDVGLVQTLIGAIGETGNAGIIQGFDNSIRSVSLPDNILHLGPFPHDVLFPHASLVVHHGGFGTLTTSVYAGKPSVVVPHRFDQPFWAARAHALGLSPKPVPARRLTLARLSAAIELGTRDTEIRVSVTRMMRKLRQEHGLVEARERIEAFARDHRGSQAAR